MRTASVLVFPTTVDAHFSSAGVSSPPPPPPPLPPPLLPSGSVFLLPSRGLLRGEKVQVMRRCLKCLVFFLQKRLPVICLPNTPLYVSLSLPLSPSTSHLLHSSLSPSPLTLRLSIADPPLLSNYLTICVCVCLLLLFVFNPQRTVRGGEVAVLSELPVCTVHQRYRRANANTHPH